MNLRLRPSQRPPVCDRPTTRSFFGWKAIVPLLLLPLAADIAHATPLVPRTDIPTESLYTPSPQPIPEAFYQNVSPPTRPDTYTIATGDRLGIVIANVPEFTSVYPVMSDGSLNLPVIGTVIVQGLTMQQASLAIARRYSETGVLVAPVVTVVLSEMNVLDVVVTGEVNRPGVYSLTPRAGKLPTLAQVIELAGGITQQANLQEVQIRRQLPQGEQVLRTSLWKLLTEGDITQNLALRDGDAVILPTAATLDPARVDQVGRSTFSPTTVSVNLVGEVRQAGLLQVPPNTPLNQALLMAGGFTNRARRSSVELIRLNPNGTISRRRIEVDFSRGIDEAANPVLRNRDVVVIGRSTLAQIGDTLGNVLAPLGNAFSLFNLFSPFFSR